ncbi:MAG: PH domain-containing protein [Bacteroidota bacterium]
MYHFPASWGTKLKVLTTVFVAILVGVSITAGTIGTIIALVILLLSLGLGVRGYSLSDDTLYVHRFGWATRYQLADLTSADLAPYATLGSVRTFGIGGLFGFVGYFRNETLGSYLAYVTDAENTVVLKFGDKPIVISPADPAAFVSRLNATASP